MDDHEKYVNLSVLKDVGLLTLEKIIFCINEAELDESDKKYHHSHYQSMLTQVLEGINLASSDAI